MPVCSGIEWTFLDVHRVPSPSKIDLQGCFIRRQTGNSETLVS